MNSDTPLVTICMPTYNHELYIEAAILSIVNQTYHNIQLIISDDGSTDKTFDIVTVYANRYPQIIYAQRHNNNLGVAKNVESIYPLIKGQYVCWFAGDDVYLPEKISRQVSLMEKNVGSIFSFHRVNVISNYGKFLYDFNDPILGVDLYTSDIAINLIKYRCFICANSVMINIKLAENIRHNTTIGVCSDWLLLFELANRGNTLYINEVLGVYRRHDNNISKNVDIINEEKVYFYMANYYKKYSPIVYAGLAQTYAMYIFKYILAKDIFMSMYCIKKLFVSIAKQPLSFPGIIAKLAKELAKRFNLLSNTGRVTR